MSAVMGGACFYAIFFMSLRKTPQIYVRVISLRDGRGHHFMKIEKICKGCGEIFLSYPSQKRECCDQECYGLWRSKSLVKENSTNWRGGLANVVCRECGETFQIKRNVVKKGDGKFCDRKCFNIWKSKNLIGSKAHTWKGGITPSQFTIRTSKKYEAWRLKVFIRDSYTCQRCHQVGGEIHAHHIKRFSVILDDIRQKFPLLSVESIAQNFKDLWNVANGITLCKVCHRNEHKKTKKGKE